MKIVVGDTVVDQNSQIGIVESRSGSQVTVRYPVRQNVRERKDRTEIQPLAELIYLARNTGKPLQIGRAISLTGNSTLAELVTMFGYSTGQMRTDSLNKVLRQLERAGLQIETRSNTWGRDERFRLTAVMIKNNSSDNGADQELDDEAKAEAASDSMPETTRVEIPVPFWPSALGLPLARELEFLSALTLNDPILCILYLPEEVSTQTWLQGTWEGLIGWAYRSAQRFHWRQDSALHPAKIRVGTVGLIHTFLKPTILDESAPQLLDSQRSLNLVTIKNNADQPNDFDRFTAVWPGSVFEFKPDLGQDGVLAEDLKNLNTCLWIASGNPPTIDLDDSPLRVLLWARRSHAQMMSKAIASWGALVTSKELRRFKGSNEGATSLSLKAHVAGWAHRFDQDANLLFEVVEDDPEPDVDESIPSIRQRADLVVEGLGYFEIESMSGSGPMESFYHRKVLSRTNNSTGKPLWLCVPNETILWAGPLLADLAHHMADGGRIVVPSADGKLLEVAGRELTRVSPEEFDRTPVSRGGATESALVEAPMTLGDVAGYGEVRKQVDELIIWPERHRLLLRGSSKSSGILFFGPPGCGKTRWARAIAGELDQEVRLLAPSDLRGPYIGWGQLMIREQFNWLAEKGSRMLIIDELDAVARSRRKGQMHEDEMASVNELLVQVDKVLRLGRLIAGTTNFIGSLDEALTRSGRFGRYIPIGPPDIEEAVKIVNYYLKLLISPAGPETRLRVSVPPEHSVKDILVPMFEENRQQRNLFCGADLEGAVTEAYRSCLRSAVPDGGWARETDALDVRLTEEELRRSLQDIPRSVHWDMVERFLEEVKRYCGPRATDFFHGQLC